MELELHELVTEVKRQYNKSGPADHIPVAKKVFDTFLAITTMPSEEIGRDISVSKQSLAWLIELAENSIKQSGHKKSENMITDEIVGLAAVAKMLNEQAKVGSQSDASLPSAR